MENPLPLDSTPRPAYSRSKSQQILPSYEPFSRNVGGYSADMDRVSQTARAVPPFPASRSYDVHAGTPAVADAGTKTLNGGELHIAHRSSGSSKHYSSTVYAPRKRRLSHSRDDIEFWASLYAQHPVYTRKTSARYPDLSSSLALSAAKDHTKNSRVSVKIWQVLTKTDLGDHPRRKHHDHHSSLVGHQLRDMDHIQFERLPIKAPQSPATAALSSSGRPFSIVFFFTVEPTAAPARRPKSSSRTHSSEPMPVPTPITLWYLETAFTRVRTVHEHMEAMGSFLPNNGVHSGRTNGQKATPPLYIYETQTLDFKQPKDGGDTVVLDLKLQSPEGIVYAEFSYKFVKDNHRAGVDGLDSIREVVGRSHSSTRTRQQRSHSSTRTRQQRSHTSTAVPSRNERDLPRKNSLGHDDSDDDYDQAMAMDDKEPAMGMVTEEPDAGEHLMQATSQFFSKMGYAALA
ncbi:hypothetical protein BGZ54_000278 [Gamsiella multidivaricata]|nr:hypothetical protein BGZ54_000278 [Gamsiella multidivaricata]